MKMLNRIFVYGTLKPGGRNYFLAEGVTHTERAYLEGYKLLHFEPEGYPAMVPALEGTSAGCVHGFILTFADVKAALPALDALEGLHLSPPRIQARHRHRATLRRAGMDVHLHQPDAPSRLRCHSRRRG